MPEVFRRHPTLGCGAPKPQSYLKGVAGARNVPGFPATPVGVDGAHGNASPRVGRYRGLPWAMRTNTFGVETRVQHHSVRLRIRPDAGGSYVRSGKGLK